MDAAEARNAVANERKEVFCSSQHRVVVTGDEKYVHVIVVDECNSTSSAAMIPWAALPDVVRDLHGRGAMHVG